MKIDLAVVNKDSLDFLDACKGIKKWFLNNIETLPVKCLDNIEGDYNFCIDGLKRIYPIKYEYTSDKIKCFYNDREVILNNKGHRLSVNYTNGRWEKYVYNDNDNLVLFEDSQKYHKTFKYDDNHNCISVNTPYIRQIKYTYDSKHNLLSSTYDDGFWEKYKYDKNNNMIYNKDSGGCWEKRIYDGRNNMIRYKDSGGCWEEYTYDDRNNILVYKDSDGDIEEYTYSNDGKYFTQTLNGKVIVKVPLNN